MTSVSGLVCSKWVQQISLILSTPSMGSVKYGQCDTNIMRPVGLTGARVSTQARDGGDYQFVPSVF